MGRLGFQWLRRRLQRRRSIGLRLWLVEPEPVPHVADWFQCGVVYAMSAEDAIKVVMSHPAGLSPRSPARLVATEVAPTRGLILFERGDR